MTATDRDVLEMWTVYERPKDFPELYIARRFEIGRGVAQATGDVIKAQSLSELRRRLPRGLQRIERLPDDEPHVVEVWT